ncbi:MmgE/PrpD family protein [Salinibacterium sp. dk2585]|uniref:MmgE/PrpD family protein n=1 Tax=unclassified Salinibacterium TaxID=2632331 RepID=UPI0011C2547E|nr:MULTISPECIES: MmgE/PrpD family protein [unclassified Salinibacterium]QEE60428.1 MmgE/PrpD family protein [Salinibacterium sp. dk2585]TXK55501.1 MmgE/PrpD family protein [Salinibacterium sp. dk5596]
MTDHAAERGLTLRLAELAVALPVGERLHADVIAQAWADTIAVSAAAVGQQGLRDIRSAVLGQHASSLWLATGPQRADDAALLNGTAAHFLDFDDVSPSMPLHPSAVLVPALMAAESHGELRFDRFAEAFNVGSAMFRYIAEALPSEEHYGRGWHSTATVGRVAAVAAIARYRRLSAEVTANALGMASSMASGSRVNFGTMTKPLHAGLAARDALHAVEWSEAGVTASTTELESKGGFFSRFGTADAAGLAETVEARFTHWVEEWPSDWGLKRYPSCYGTHRPIDAALELRALVPAEQVARVEVEIYRGGSAPLTPRPPEAGTEAKFSLEYCTALAWLRGNVALLDFADAHFAADRAEVAALASRISLREVDGEGEFAHVTVFAADGGSHHRTVTLTKGSGGNPMGPSELQAKLRSCLEFAGVAGGERLLAGADGYSPEQDLIQIAAELRLETGS